MNEIEPSEADSGPRTPGFLVVGVGASAGGLEAFERLLTRIPASAPLALVLVQHLARDHQSILPQLLAAKTELKVEEGKDGARIQPGHAYVIAPNTHMSVIDGHLRVQPRPAGRALDVPVDHLFDSMADEYCEKAIGVVLSGGGSDGSYGLQRIHNAGGITFAQAPDESSAESMPRAAVATGAVSMVLSARDIAQELVRLSEHPFYRQAGRAEPQTHEESEADLQGILRVLRRVTGVDFTRYKMPTIRRRIQRRMAIHHTYEFSAYLALLVKSPEEAKQLHDDILIHVTSFFRDPESFGVLKQAVLPQLVHMERGKAPLRVWVPGCSSGEEVYSLCITLLDVIEQCQQAVELTVFGTDLSQRMIEHARAGLYSENIAADVPAETLRRYFVKVDGGYRVSAEVRERCVFARQDITRDPPFSKLDMVMCRNLLIYLSQAAQRKVTEIFHYALLPQGVLALGRSETIGQLPELFSVLDGRWKIYQRKQTTLAPHVIDFGAHHPETSAGMTKAAPRVVVRERRERDLQAETNRLLIERYAPPLVVVDEAFRVVRTQGRTAPFLELPVGEVSLDLLRMIRPGLMTPVRAALQEVRSSGGSIRKERLEVRTEDSQRLINIEVSRLAAGEGQNYLVLFEDATPHGVEPAVLRKSTPDADDPNAVEQLQIELSDVRAELESLIQELEAANEELQSANEEILSSNEELQSTNEELDTAREELQATNEELGTVNEELQARNSELSRANGDLLNLLDSVDIPIVMVTSDLNIRRFTQAAQRTLNLIPSDVGRPIGHIKPNIGFGDLEALLREVIERSTLLEREVHDSEGRTYLAAVRPYTSLSNKVDGAVLALFDVSEPLKVAREMGEALMSAVREPILLLDSNMVVQRANEAFYQTFQQDSSVTEGKLVFELCGGQWDIPGLREVLLETLSRQGTFENLIVEQDFSAVGVKRLSMDGRRIGSARAGDGVILLMMRELSK